MSGTAAAIIELLTRPEVVMAVSTATEVFVRDLLRSIATMTPAELEIFIGGQQERKRLHDEWLAKHRPKEEGGEG